MVMADIGQTDFGQTDLTCGVVCLCVCVLLVLLSRFHGVEFHMCVLCAQIFALFFPSPAAKFVLCFLL